MINPSYSEGDFYKADVIQQLMILTADLWSTWLGKLCVLLQNACY